MAGRLHVVATPIGNLGDVTSRCTVLLKSLPILACEDTRRTRALLAHIGVRPRRLVTLHDHNERDATAKLIDALLAGEDVGLVSDAGTPLVSDPGFELVRAAWQQGIPVSPVPGGSAITAALSVSPIPINRFSFEGFLPGKAHARRSAIARLVETSEPVIFFEAPHRMRRTLGELVAAGAELRPILICRELTKRFETLSFVTVGQALGDGIVLDRGELTCILAPGQDRAKGVASSTADVVGVLASELPPAQAARLASRITGEPRSALYDIAVRALATTS